MMGTTDDVCIGSDPEVGRIDNCVCGQDLPFGKRPSSAETRTVSNAPLQDIAGLLLDARKLTLFALTLSTFQEAPSSGNHAQLGQYS